MPRTLFEPAAAADVQSRLRALTPAHQRQWGKMTLPQALAHCSAAMEMAVDDTRPKRMMIGRVIGPLIRRLALGNERPIKKNSPTAPNLLIRDDRNFEAERARLGVLVNRFATGAEAKCTRHPHPFFGSMTPDQWAELMYKHIDHHLRQFSA